MSDYPCCKYATVGVAGSYWQKLQHSTVQHCPVCVVYVGMCVRKVCKIATFSLLIMYHCKCSASILHISRLYLGNPLNGGPKIGCYSAVLWAAIVNYYRLSMGYRVSMVRVRIRVSVRIRFSLVLVIGWTNETKPNPNLHTNPNRNPTKPYHLMVCSEYMPLISISVCMLGIWRRWSGLVFINWRT